ncbi:histone-lysine N-methyltransferase SETMAR [Anticarsia gemmatalis]|uniref:histone-lysine N-methyltransferase SETMAR n=1 Tax=Anticarsia gemmatalis TaxID=129554 RepID=UPI003F761C51
MNDNYTHAENNVFYTVENIIGPLEQSTEYERLLNDFNSQLTEHCTCEESCSYALCKCLDKSGSYNFNYSSNWHIETLEHKSNLKTDSPPIFECNQYCQCTNECGNRVVQRGPIEGLEIKQCNKGLGLFTTNFIPKGTFVCEYAGEVITRSQAATRHQSNLINSKMNYIFCLKEHCGESVVETFVDPSLFGNIGRYMNHSCEPNCCIVPVRCDTLVPKLAIFARVDILPNEELTFHYGDSDGSDSVDCRIKCLCKTKNCSGYIPFNKY